jgi:PhzF family phenazine biosynthesis protein
MTEIRLVDAFTDTPFRGNPAGVCILNAPVDERWMQDVAAEMNVAETAFLWPESDQFRLRWFTPATEVDLCGHATLATAHALWEAGILPLDREAVFATRSGALRAFRDGDMIALDFPAEGAESEIDRDEIARAIGARVEFASRNRFDFLAEVESAETVRTLRPDIEAIRRLDCRGLIVTAGSDDPRYEFVSRFFAPSIGIIEDPVTGSAHCFLGPYWGERLRKSKLVGRQESSRGGEVAVEVHGDRVLLKGRAVTVLKGQIYSYSPTRRK